MNAPARAPNDRISSVRIVIVCMMFGLSVMSYFDRTIMSIAGPAIIKEFGLSETAMGTVYSAFTLGYALLMIPGGRLADRFGPRRMLTFMALGSALFTAMTALGAKPGLGSYLGIIPALILMRLLFGFCTAPLYPTCGRMNADWIPQAQRARVQGLVNAGAGLGGAVAPLLFTWLIIRVGWRLSFCVAAAATAALGLGWFTYTRDHPAEHSSLHSAEGATSTTESDFAQTDGKAPWRILLTNKNLLLLTLGYFTVGYFQYIIFYWMYYYLGEIRHLSANQSAVYTTTLFLTFGSMMSIGGWISDRVVSRYGRKAGYRIVGASGLGLSAVLLYAGVNMTDTTTAVALMSLALGCSAVSDVTFWAAAIEVAGQEVGSACGIVNTGGNVGGLIAPITSPLIAASLGWSSALYFGSGMAAVGLLTWLYVDASRTINYSPRRSANAAFPP
jgi:ACS family glucarate transporter-like MFS transporter